MKLDQRRKRIKINDFTLEDPVVFDYFDKLKEEERDSALSRAIRIGVLALAEDRISSFLANTRDELGIQLESLKVRLDMKQKFYNDTAKKGVEAENIVISFLQDHLKQRGYEDVIESTGKVRGNIAGNKTGDIVAIIQDEKSIRKIAIECKYDKSVILGDIKSNDIEKNRKDTAWSQLLEAAVNRDANTSIIVFDEAFADASVIQKVDGIHFINDIGFVCIIDSQTSDYRNLAITYNLARSLVLRETGDNIEVEFVNLLINRILQDIKDIQSIEKMVKDNINNNHLILKRIQKGILTIEFTQKYLEKYLKDGKISKTDLLDFYQREEIREKFKVLSSDIDKLSDK